MAPHFLGGGGASGFRRGANHLADGNGGGLAPPPIFEPEFASGGPKTTILHKISYFFTARTDGKSKISARAFCARRSIELYQEQLRQRSMRVYVYAGCRRE